MPSSNSEYMRVLTYFIACLGIATLQSAYGQSGYEIQIQVDGFSQNEAYLAYYYGDKQYIKDTASAAKGSFTFQGEEALDGGIYMVVMPPSNKYFELMVDKDQHFTVRTDTVDFVANMKIEGSKENVIFYEDIRFLADKRTTANKLNESLKSLDEDSEEAKRLKAQLEGINTSVQEQRKKMMEKYPDHFYTAVLKAMEDVQIPEEIRSSGDQTVIFYYYRDHFFDKIDFSDGRLLRTPILHNKVNTYLEQLTVKHPDSIAVSADHVIDKARENDDVFQYFVVNILNKYAQSKIMGMDAMYVHMVEKYYMSGEAWWADSAQVATMIERALAISPTLVGRIAPNFRAQDTEGNWQHVHGIQGKYTILYFWDYDCGHCKKVTPVLAEAYKDYMDKDVSLFAVSINGDVEEWKEKVKEYGLDKGINAQDHMRQSGFDKMYDIRSTPRIFILDENKKIIAKHIGVDQVKEILDRELDLKKEEG